MDGLKEQAENYLNAKCTCKEHGVHGCKQLEAKYLFDRAATPEKILELIKLIHPGCLNGHDWENVGVILQRNCKRCYMVDRA